MAFVIAQGSESLKITTFAINVRMKKMQEISVEKLGRIIIESIQEKKGQEIVQLDLRKTNNSVCEFFIIAHADSNIQVKAIAKNIEENLRKNHETRALHAEGYENAHWILLDYISIVVHIFQQGIRDYYKLEELWEDAEIERIEDPGAVDIKKTGT